MAHDVILANYDTLQQVAHRFTKAGQKIQRVEQELTQRLGVLRGSWEGEGAIAFFAEMQQTVQPGVRRLMKALQEASTRTAKMSQLIYQAEEDAARLFKGDAEGGVGGGDGDGLTGNDVISDEVTTIAPQSLGDIAAQIATNAITTLFGVNIAFPASSPPNNMPRFAEKNAPDPIKPSLQSATAENGGDIAQAAFEIATLQEYGVTLNQNGEAHWTPEEIHQVYVAVTNQANVAHARAVTLGLIDPNDVTPQQVFQDVYTQDGNGLIFTRSSQDSHETGAYAWKSGNTFTLYDASFYGGQTTGRGAKSGLHFTPSLLIQHEISHQLNQIHTAISPTYESDDPDSTKTPPTYTPNDYYAAQFPINDGVMSYTFHEDTAIGYYKDGRFVSETILAGTTIATARYAPGASYLEDAGYDFRARTHNPDDEGYNSEERVTDGHLAEILGAQGGYASMFQQESNANNQGTAAWAAARNEVNTAIFNAVLTNIYGKPSEGV